MSTTSRGLAMPPPPAVPPGVSPHPAEATACPEAIHTQAKVNPGEGRASAEMPGRTGAGHTNGSQEASLIAAIFAQAMADACNPVEGGRHPPKSPNRRDHVEAWMFLTSDTGKLAENRKLYAGLVGVEDSIITRSALARGPNIHTQAALEWYAKAPERRAKRKAEAERKKSRTEKQKPSA